MDFFIEISLIIVIATAISGIVRFLRQPLIIGYILTGLIVGPYAFNILKEPEALEIFSQLGITLLLFIVGLNLSPKVIREVGKVAVFGGVGQVIFTSTIGFLICIFLGFTYVEAAYIAIALTFSSTIIILKLLSDKGDLDKLYGKISVGFLLVQDIIATVILVIVSSMSLSDNIGDIFFQLFWKGLLLAGVLYFFAKYVLPEVIKFFARSQEFLFLFSIAWGVGIAALFHYLGFSIEIGALIAGITLSLFPYHYEISAKLRPLRDFFLIIFFILLGSQLVLADITALAFPALLLSAFVLIGNPLIVIAILGYLKFNKRIGFKTGLTVAQISEFSLILVALGLKLGHVENSIMSLVTMVGLVTITGSSYMIIYSDKIYMYLSRYLSVFERKGAKKTKNKTVDYDIVLFGYNRIGYDFVKVFRKLDKKFMVVDFNPDVIANLNDHNVPCTYGDAGDNDFLEEVNLSSAKMIISTIPDFEINAFLMEKMRQVNENALIMLVSHTIDEAKHLYERGADYVIMPHFLGGKYASSMLQRYEFDIEKFASEKKKHINHLEKRQKLGHEHPKVSKNKHRK